MNRYVLAAGLIALALVTPVWAQDDGHEANVGAITIVHPWARAAEAGADGLVFMEIENGGVQDRLMGGRTALAGDVHIVGLTLSGDQVVTQEIGPIAVAPGHFMLDTGGVALALHDLSMPLVEGEHIELVVMFEIAGEVTIEVEIEAADASQHSHAGHSHL